MLYLIRNKRMKTKLNLLIVLFVGIVLISGCIGEDKKGSPEEIEELTTSQTDKTPKADESQDQKEVPEEPVVTQTDETPITEPQPKKSTKPPVPEGFKTYVNTEANWSIYYPVDWDVVFFGKESINLKKQIISGENIVDLRLSVKIIPPGEIEGKEDISAREFFEQEWTNWIEKPEGYTNYKISEIKINGINGIEHNYIDLGPKGSVELPMEQTDVWLKKDEFVAVISFSGPEYSFGKYSQLFEQISDTFHLLE